MSFSVVFMTVDVRIALKFSGGGGCSRSIKQPVFKDLFALGNAGGSLAVSSVCQCWPTSY